MNALAGLHRRVAEMTREERMAGRLLSYILDTWATSPPEGEHGGVVHDDSRGPTANIVRYRFFALDLFYLHRELQSGVSALFRAEAAAAA